MWETRTDQRSFSEIRVRAGPVGARVVEFSYKRPASIITTSIITFMKTILIAMIRPVTRSSAIPQTDRATRCQSKFVNRCTTVGSSFKQIHYPEQSELVAWSYSTYDRRTCCKTSVAITSAVVNEVNMIKTVVSSMSFVNNMPWRNFVSPEL